MKIVTSHCKGPHAWNLEAAWLNRKFSVGGEQRDMKIVTSHRTGPFTGIPAASRLNRKFSTRGGHVL